MFQSQDWVKVNERFWVVVLGQGHKPGLCFPELPSLWSASHREPLCMRRGRRERSLGWAFISRLMRVGPAHAQLHARRLGLRPARGPRPSFPQPGAASTLGFCRSSLSKCQLLGTAAEAPAKPAAPPASRLLLPRPQRWASECCSSWLRKPAPLAGQPQVWGRGCDGGESGSGSQLPSLWVPRCLCSLHFPSALPTSAQQETQKQQGYLHCLASTTMAHVTALQEILYSVSFLALLLLILYHSLTFLLLS